MLLPVCDWRHAGLLPEEAREVPCRVETERTADFCDWHVTRPKQVFCPREPHGELVRRLGSWMDDYDLALVECICVKGERGNVLGAIVEQEV